MAVIVSHKIAALINEYARIVEDRDTTVPLNAHDIN